MYKAPKKPKPIVVGQPVNFTASGGTGTFAWTATGGTPASGSNSTFSTTYNSTGSKTVTVTSGTQTANCGVTVNPAASLTCTPGTQSVTIGQTANFSANGDEGKGLYQWTATGGSPASGSGVNFSTVYTSTGTKIVSVTNGGVSAANCSVTVTASTGATLACSPATQSVLVNQNASFTASGRGDGTSITYSWTATNGTPSGGSGTTFQTRYGSPGTYTVSVRDGSVSRDCTVIVNPVIQTQSADLSLTKIANPTTLLVNNLVVFTIVVSNDGPNTATGVSVSDVLPSTLTFNSAVATQGNYNSSDGVWTIGAINSLASIIFY
jgi:uncharacterized repeat protein (TIGR01451 family)